MTRVYTVEEITKAQNNLVPQTRTVKNANGTTYQLTVWVNPTKSSGEGEHPAGTPKMVTKTGKDRKEREQRTPSGMSRDEAAEIDAEVKESVRQTKDRIKEGGLLVRQGAIRRAIPGELHDDPQFYEAAIGAQSADYQTVARKLGDWYERNYRDLPDLQGLGPRKRADAYRDHIAKVQIGHLMRDIAAGKV